MNSITHSEDIYGRAFIGFLLTLKLRGHVIRRSTLSHEGLAVGTSEDLLETEISDLDLSFSVQKAVLKLEITMSDALFVDVLDGASQLSEHLASFRLAETTSGFYVVKGLSVGSQ